MSEETAPTDPQPSAFYNWMSVIGATVVVVFGTALLFFLGLGLWSREETGYGGLTLLPLLLAIVVGACLVAFGWRREAKRQARGERSSFFETITFDPFRLARGTGALLTVALIAGVSFAFLSAGAGSLALVEYSESNAFCMDACHTMMAPEAVSYLNSPHARVPCVECHVAPGTEGFLRAKIGGMRQLFATLAGSASRPIPTPLHGGVLSRKVCVGCHHPDADHGFKALTRRYFLADEDVTPVRLAMVVKVGGGGENGLLAGSGVHYHMQIAKKVEYKARDPQRQDIAWVRVTDTDGAVREYDQDSAALTAEEHASIEPRVMDCLDCHNRVAHPYPSPTDSVNRALGAGSLPTALPYAKEASVRALDGGYETVDAARKGIGEQLRAFYEDADPEVLEEHGDLVREAADGLYGIYEQSIFPEMKADWRAHPDNGSHRDSPGCFRCHNDEMLDADGEGIFSDCTSCHAILARDDEGIQSMEDFDFGRDFVHPEDFDTLVEFTACADCHTGGKALYE